jgi:nucleotide-binding universal stress UspA family protein
MFRRILVPTDGSDAARKCVRYAAQLGAAYRAELVGLFVSDIKLLEGPMMRDVSAAIGGAPYVPFEGGLAEALEERGTGALRDFEEACAAHGVTCQRRHITGLVERTIIEEGELADLIVLGRSGEHSPWLEGLLGSTTSAVVRRSVQPVLVTGWEEFRRDRFVAAYDGSAHAKQALHVAADVSGDLDASLTVLVVGGRDAGACLEEAQSYLEAHEVQADFVREEGDPSEVIVEYSKNNGASLLFMGAYGHTKVRELVVGSTTAYALNHAPCPLLLSR